MTLSEIEAMEKAVLTCAEVAPVLMANPHTLHLQAVECPERLGFPVIVAGNRVKIPRIPFLMFMNGKRPTAGTADPDAPTRGERTEI